jgi:transcription-repair coupling factor (superfamily II helicase)
MLSRLMEDLLDRLATTGGMTEWLAAMENADDNLVISGLRAGGVAAALAALARKCKHPLLVVTSSLDRAEALTDGALFFGAHPLIFPNFDTLPFETTEPVLHLASSRIRVLARLASLQEDAAGHSKEPPPLIIAPIDALLTRVLPPQALAPQVVRLTWAQTVDAETLATQLTAMGFTREALVESPGEFAIRGSIIDIFPPDAELPWRLDLFGDEIEQIRKFDPGTQRSQPLDREIEAVEILPSAIIGPKLDWLMRGERLTSVFNFLTEDTIILIDGPSRIEQRLLHFDDTATRHWNDIQKPREHDAANFFVEHRLTPGAWLLSALQAREAIAGFRTISLATISADDDASLELTPTHAVKKISVNMHSFESIPSQFTEYVGLIRERQRKGHWVIIVCDNNGQVLRLDELLREQEVSALPVTQDSNPGLIRNALPMGAQAEGRDVILCIGELHEGFYSNDAGLFVVTDREIFGRYKKRHIYRKAFRGKPVANPAEIQRGDYVVHMEHGIGLFERIRRQEVDGHMAEFLELTYQEGDKLLVPVDKLHQIQKYASADGKVPALDKLGSKRWDARRRKSMEAVRKMAGELLELYARRAAAEGFAYNPDSTWQNEFEASFIYQETPDQLKAIDDVKRDMIAPKPMDRLVCGDVGYGKTEVAIRAAFKALTEGRQVALLAPTTLLVQQHFNTFVERFADYPFKVGMLSRFRSAKQQREELELLEQGALHLMVGTHRILSKDVKFKDLGLLIVDEEQRFGVAQKEKIKQLRANVDILTLSATPIPRTLYMALSGLRDLSIITTPPADRHPIKTRTIHWDREAIEEAILRELNRGGQVYFIHNRIETIHDVAATLHDIVPNAKMIVAHGQMEENKLEQIMMDFIGGKHDILISTTIVENGIDIPNVNTIIINRADAFGLAQLYQLRGRVGRDVRQAYAYLILPPGQAITPTAIKRLEALEEFTDLGVGFSIAMRDMEIRGTGNILGREQHGAITDIGFEMYCRMLEEAVGELKGQPVAEPLWPVEIKVSVDQFFPDEYIPIESQRIRFYKDVAGARTLPDIDLLVEELVDRYGALPPQAVNLVNVARLKIAAAPWRIDTIRAVPGDRNMPATVRIKAPIFSMELATALAETAGVARGTFVRLRRQSDQLILDVRDEAHDEDEVQKLDPVLQALTDYFEALPPLEEPAPLA